MTQNLSYISVPSSLGASRVGTEEAPSALCQLLSVKPKIVCKNQPLTHSNKEDNVINLREVVTVCKTLRDTVYQSQAEGLPFVIGGDHSIALGSVAGSLMHDANMGVVWFDAHGDINTESTSPTGNIHGMPVAALMGLCESELNEVATVRLKPQNMFWVGARDLDPGEKETIERLGIADHVYSTEYIHQIGMQAVMQDIASKMQTRGINHWHLSFDIDGMDPTLIPATGVPVPNGMNQADLDAFIQSMPLLPELQSMDFVEYNPMMDDVKQPIGHWCASVIKRIF